MSYIKRPKVKKLLAGIVVLITLYGCNNNNAGGNSLFDSLVGTWKLDEDDQYERWSKNDDGTYLSTGYSVNGKDTLISEKVAIYPKGGNWCFETMVTGQNNGKAIVFTSVILTDSLVQFENKEHDFPNIINYHLRYQNNLRAFIAGKADTIYFNYNRVRL
jgi:hypothetical protein